MPASTWPSLASPSLAYLGNRFRIWETMHGCDFRQQLGLGSHRAGVSLQHVKPAIKLLSSGRGKPDPRLAGAPQSQPERPRASRPHCRDPIDGDRGRHASTNAGSSAPAGQGFARTRRRSVQLTGAGCLRRSVAISNDSCRRRAVLDMEPYERDLGSRLPPDCPYNARADPGGPAAHATLSRYAALRKAAATDRTETFATEFVLKLLKKRLFSSPEAFRLTLEKHRKSVGVGGERGDGAAEAADRGHR
jgi:hypothetical protein